MLPVLRATTSTPLLSRVCAGMLAVPSGMPSMITVRGAKRGTKPNPRYEWDMKHLQELTSDGYTHMPLRVKKLGGREPETGHRVSRHVGGGYKFDYFVVDFHRRGPTEPGKTYDERVIEVRRDANRTSHIALVAGQKGKRWILATENMVAGKIISTSQHIPQNPVVGVEGNCYPLGALAPGAFVNSIERHPGPNGEPMIVNAGCTAEIVRHKGEYTVIKMPNQHEYAFHNTCMATVGRLSHGDLKNKQYGSPNMHRRFGYMPSSGLWHRKDGTYGRKIRPLPPTRYIDEQAPLEPRIRFTLTKRQLSHNFGPAAVDQLLIQLDMRF